MSHHTRDYTQDVNKKELKALYTTKPHLHVLAMAGDWAIILGTAFLCATYFNPVLYVLAVLIIGARMHALAILMHDASHFRFLRNKKKNDLVTNLFSMYPLFSSIEQYRDNHLRHHRHLNTDEDPDWFIKLGRKEFTFPKSKREFLITVLGYFTLVAGIKDALWFLKRFGGNSNVKNKSFKKKLPRLAFYAVLITALSLLGIWKEFALYWLVPYFSTFFMFQYIRSVAEHFGELAYDHDLTHSRTIIVNPLERFFLSPHNVGYHLEHHLYPGVPFYHLPQLHRLLMGVEAYRTKAHVTHGFWRGLMNEMGATSLYKVIASID